MEPHRTPFGIRLVKLEGRTHLSFALGDLNEVPPERCEPTRLGSVDLSSTQLSELPTGIGRLKNLETLGVDGNPADSGRWSTTNTM